MPVRIYALAKELKLDSKELVDLLPSYGISGKGSALASLTEDEEALVREKHSGSAPAPAETGGSRAAVMAAKPSAPAKPAAPVRELGGGGSRRPAAINVGRSKRTPDEVASSADAAAGPAPRTPADVNRKPGPLAAGGRAKEAPSARTNDPKPTPTLRAPKLAPAPTQPEPERPSNSPKPEAGIEELKQQARAAEEAKAKQSDSPKPVPKPGRGGLASRIANRMGNNSGVGRVVPNTPGQPVAAARRDEGAGGSRMRSLDRVARRGEEDSKAPADAGRGKKREPRIALNLAQMPDAPKPAAPVDPGQAAQKPDIKLTRDVIEGHKQGMKAPLEKLERTEAEKKQRGKKTGSGSFAPDRKAILEEEERSRKKKLAGMASARAERSRGGGGRRDLRQSDDRGGRRQRQTLRRKGTNTAAPRKEKVQLELPCTVRSFCEAAGIQVAQVMKVMMGMGMMLNINADLDLETAELLATELDLDIELKAAETLEDEVISQIEDIVDDEDSLVARPPIVTFLGHVDHGKTSLLDNLIGINVVKGEAGGITQHIRAYEVDKDGRSVTFVDTPGHEAFTEMRARGANVTDIAVLVVAADDGIMPQTEEAISHAKAAEVPIVVALNKCDLEGVDPNRVMTQLTEHQLTPSEWGGDVEVVRTSAITGEGMDDLLETLLTVAELHEYRANPERDALGICLEAEQQGDRGVVAKLIVRNGTLRTGDIIVCGPAHGRVRRMTNTLTGETITDAGPSTPVSLIGLDIAPGAGDRFHVLDDIAKAREIAESRAEEVSRQSLSGITTKVSFENFQEMLEDGRLGQTEERIRLNVIIRADVKGSLEAIDKELSKFDHPEVEIRVLQRSVGGITLADVTLASASDAVIVGFNVIPDEQARSLADERSVQIRRYDVIYKLTDDIKAMIEGRLKPEERVVELGRALVKQTFQISRVGTIAGCYVMQGQIQRNCRVRVNRDNRTIGDYALDTLRRHKEDVREVPRGMECGIRLAGFNDIKQDDVLEAYNIEEVARTLD
ncbi:MAG: translation initiation factor IF-2 [Planctomycetota bacterium]